MECGWSSLILVQYWVIVGFVQYWWIELNKPEEDSHLVGIEDGAQQRRIRDFQIDSKEILRLGSQICVPNIDELMREIRGSSLSSIYCTPRIY